MSIINRKIRITPTQRRQKGQQIATTYKMRAAGEYSEAIRLVHACLLTFSMCPHDATKLAMCFMEARDVARPATTHPCFCFSSVACVRIRFAFFRDLITSVF